MLFRQMGKLPAMLAAITALVFLSVAAASVSAPAHDSYAAFAEQVKNVREALASLYGKDAGLSAMPSEIASEVKWMNSEESSLKSELKKVEETGKSVDEEEDLQTRKEKLAALDHEELELRRKPYLQQKEKIEADMADNERRRDIHNNNKPGDEDEAGMARWNDEAIAGNAEHARLNEDMQKVEEQLEILDGQEQRLNANDIELAERRNYLDKRKDSFAADLSAFMGRCDEATVRVQALAEIAGEKPANLVGGFSRVTDKRPNPLIELGKSVGKDALLATLSALVVGESGGTAAVWGPTAAEVVVKLSDILPPGADERTREVQDNVLLIGDYAQALRRLKDEGRLAQGDPGYDAIRKMLKERGQEMPGSGPEFFYQSEARIRTVEDGLAEVASHYAGEAVKPGELTLTKKMAERERQLCQTYGGQLKAAAAKLRNVPAETAEATAINKVADKSKEIINEALKGEHGGAEKERQ